CLTRPPTAKPGTGCRTWPAENTAGEMDCRSRSRPTSRFSMTLRIRRFRLPDLNRLLEIEQAAFPKAAYPRDLFLELYEDCGQLFFVALRGRSIAGYSVVCTRLPRAELISIAVDPKNRRQGIAEALLKRTLGRLRQ